MSSYDENIKLGGIALIESDVWRMRGEDSCSKEDFPTFVVVVMMGK